MAMALQFPCLLSLFSPKPGSFLVDPGTEKTVFCALRHIAGVQMLSGWHSHPMRPLPAYF
jgi:hypothetical protein